MKRIWISFVAASLLAIAAIAPASADNHTTTIDLSEVEDSGVTGTATLTTEGEETTVEIELEGAPDDGVHPAHIHEGTCDDLGDVVYPLENVEGGSSESTVDVTLDDILAGDHAINVHLSEDEIDVYVACGNIAMEDGAEDGDAATDDDDAAAEEDDDAVAEDEEDDAAAEDDDAATDEDDDAAAEEDDEAAEDEGDDATAEDDDAATDEDDDAAAEDDDAATDEGDDEAEDVVPATGATDGFSPEAGMLMITLAAGATLGGGLLIRRRSLQY